MNDEIKQDAIVKGSATAVEIPSAQNLRLLAQDLMNSGMFPAVRNVAGAITIIEYGRELGIPPVAALQTMAIVNGRLCMEAKAMLALFQNHGGRVKILERSKTVARIEFSKDGMEAYVHEYTLEQAKQERLSDKDNWKKMPETMLFWRAVATGIRLYDPGAIFGIYSKEELLDVGGNGGGVATTLATPPEKMQPRASQGQKQPIVEEATDSFFNGGKAAPEQGGPYLSQVIDRMDSLEPPLETNLPIISTDKEPFVLFSNDAINAIVDAIKEALRVEGIDEKEYKAWLYHYQTEMKPVRKFVGMKFNHPSFHEGDPEDLKWLHGKLWDSTRKYLAWKRKKEAAK